MVSLAYLWGGKRKKKREEKEPLKEADAICVRIF